MHFNLAVDDRDAGRTRRAGRGKGVVGGVRESREESPKRSGKSAEENDNYYHVMDHRKY